MCNGVPVPVFLYLCSSPLRHFGHRRKLFTYVPAQPEHLLQRSCPTFSGVTVAAFPTSSFWYSSEESDQDDMSVVKLKDYYCYSY